MAYSQETLQKIKDKLTISDVAGRYSRIVRRGKDNWCCCPIHGEKTPSMILHDDTGFYKCFGCGAHGNIFDLVMQMEKIGFNDAVRMLAKDAGVDLVQLSPEQEQAEKQKETLYALHERLAAYAHNVLLKSKATQVVRARGYLEGRNVSPAMIEAFRIGYIPDRDYTPDHNFSLRNLLKDYSDEVLDASGLFARDHKDYCLFTGRIVFPIRTWQGRTVGFSGRDLSGRSRAKYINSYESPIFNKRDNLLGLYESLPALKKKDGDRRIIICEGNFDVVALHQAGLATAMASLGTAFTADHVRIMKRYAEKVVCLFDNDDAGERATSKALLILQNGELAGEVGHLSFPDCKDASDVLVKHGPVALQQALQQTKDGFAYLVDTAIHHYDITSAEGKLSVMRAVLPYLQATKSSIVLDDFLQKLAASLGVDKEAVMADFSKASAQGALVPPPPRDVPAPEKKEPGRPQPTIRPLRSNDINIELRCMLLVVNNRSLYGEVRSRLGYDDLHDGEAKMLYRVLEDVKREGVGTVSNEYILQKIEDPQLKSDVQASFGMEEFTGHTEYGIRESLDRIQIANNQKRQREIQAMLSASDNAEEIAELLKELSETSNTISRLRASQKARQKTRPAED